MQTLYKCVGSTVHGHKKKMFVYKTGYVHLYTFILRVSVHYVTHGCNCLFTVSILVSNWQMHWKSWFLNNTLQRVKRDFLYSAHSKRGTPFLFSKANPLDLRKERFAWNQILDTLQQVQPRVAHLKKNGRQSLKEIALPKSGCSQSSVQDRP